MALSVVTWLPVAKPGVPSTSSLCSVNVAGATNLAGVTGDAMGDVVEANIMLDRLAPYLT